MTLVQAKATLRALGFTLSHRDGEYRVAPIDGTPAQKEARANYTDDLDDAIGTARHEAARAMRDAAAEAHRAVRMAERDYFQSGQYQREAAEWQADITPSMGFAFGA
jgi:hypothetical protein